MMRSILIKILFILALGATLTPIIILTNPTQLLAQPSLDDEEEDLEDEIEEDDVEEEEDEETASLSSTDADESSTEIHVKDAEISSIIKIFSKKTKRNYILDERVKGKVSIFLPAKVSDNEATRILDAILALKGFTTVPIGGNIYKIIPSKDAKKTTIPTVVGMGQDDPTATVVTRLVRLNYVGAQDLQNLLSQLVSADGLISAYSRSNSLVIIDYADNIKRIVDIIKSVDIPSSDSDMTIVPVTHADAVEIADTIKDILGEQGGTDDSSGGSATRAVDIIRNRLREAAAARNEGQAGGMDGSNMGLAVQDKAAKIIPDKRTNSIILVASEAETMRLRALITQLDSPVNLSSNRFYVYRCQHAKAEDLADVLAGLTGSGTTGSRNSSLGDSDSSFGTFNTGASSRSTSRSRTQERLNSQQRTLGQTRQPTTISGGGSVNFGEDLAITADPSTNSLIIAANKTDHEKIIELLKEIDIKRRQVQVEATLLEVALTDATQLGFEYSTSTGGSDGGVLASQNFSNLTSLFSNPAALTNFTIAAASAGTIRLPGGASIPSQAAIITAAKTNSNVNVLSAPNILTTDNEEAEIVVGQNVPFISSTSTTQENLNNTFNQVDRQDVGITLRLTPQISSGEFVTLRIFTEVSNVVDSSADSPLGPTTTLRTSQTTVITKSGQMVAIGGLMSDDVNETETGVPFLKDIPLFGQLFRATNRSKRQTNLLIFITPKIISDQFDSREETLGYRDQLESKIIENGAYPDRSEILKSERLDNVAEATRVTEPQPGTIRGPSNIPQQDIKTEQLLQNSPNHGDPISGLPQDNSSTIVLRVTPPLPKLPNIQLENSIDSLNPTTNNETTPKSHSLIQKNKYILLKPNTSSLTEIAEDLPFEYNPNEAIGIIVPVDTSPIASKFFVNGERYGYAIGDAIIDFEATGIFNSAEDAHQNTPGKQYSWRTLSPYEIMNLGKGPWLKR